MVERTLSSFPKFLSEGIGNLISPGSQNKGPAVVVNRGFVTFLNTVHRHDKTGGKYETEQAFQQELSLIQQKISSPDVTQAQIRDYLCRAIYCGMLGYDVSFAYIHAIKLAQQGTLIEKRIGYLAASLLLHPGHEMVLLLVSTIQKDLNSSNILDNCMALTAASQMIGNEMIPILLPAVLDSLKHRRELVRQKAVMCLYRFQLLAPDLLAHVQTDLERALFDKDPSVMAAAVNIVNHNIQQTPTKYLHLADTLISIQQQIMSRKMSAMFEYQSVPFPWLQIKLLRCLSNLAAVDEHTQKKICPLLIEVLQRASSKENIAYALIYECLQCISVVKPDGKVIGEAVTHVGRFMRSADPNLRYVGVKTLLGLVKVDTSFLMDYQHLIVDSLEHSDQTIQRKMYKLLYQIANPTNVEVICDKLLHQLEISLDKFWRSEVITMVMDLTERFSPSVTWQYSTKLRCLQLGGENVKPSVTESVLSSLKTGCSSEKTDLKQFLVKKCVECLMSDKTHYNVIHVTSWSLAELSPLLTKLPEDRVMSLYTRHLYKPDLPDPVKACLISGLQKLMCGSILSKETMATRLFECLKFKQPVLIKQQITVLYRLCKIGTNIRLCREPEEFDFTLSFLDSYLCQCIEDGARPYKPRHLRFMLKGEDAAPAVTEVKTAPGVKSRETASDSVYSSSHYRTNSTTSSERHKEESEAKLDLSSVKRVWGKQGIITKNQAPRMTQLQSEGSSDDRKQHERQQMAAALFGGMTAVGNEKGHLAGEQTSRSSFGASDQDLTTLLPSSDTGGWRSYHKDHAEKNEVEKNTKQHSSDNLNSETANDEMENKTKHLENEDHSLLNFPTTRMADHDTGYESKLLYDEFSGTDPILGGNLELNQNSNFSDLNNAASYTQNNTLYSDDNFDENCLTNQDKENNTKSEFSQGFVTSDSAHVPNFASVNEDQATRNDLDEALSLLLNDSSSFVNISIVSQDQNSSLLDSRNTDNSRVQVRQSIYSLKEDRTFDGLNNLHNKEDKTVQEETDTVSDGGDKGAVGGSLYDDDDDT